MSRIKQLKNESINNINVIELLSILCGSKTKYIETLLRIIKNEKKHKTHLREIRTFLLKDIGISEEILKTIPENHLMFFHTFMEYMIGFDDIKKYQKFIDYNERGLIENKDLSTYKSFSQVMTYMSIAEIKDYEKELQGQIIKIYEDEDWIVVKPLTHESSMKYGSNTKWCTAASQTSDYFISYTQTGILIYIINKKTGKKVALHRTHNKVVSYWSQEDKKINIEEANIPQYIQSMIQKSLRDERSNQMIYNMKKQIVNEPNPEVIQRRRGLSNRIVHAIRREDNCEVTNLQIKIKR
jgi:hypothetical protein